MFRTWTLAFLTLVSANLSADEAMNGFLAESEVQEQMKRSENICISMMLLGCMGFMMSNFYLVNWPDADIRRISWEVISSTVSIFSAVLLFQAVNKVLEYYLLEGMWIWFQLVVDMVHMLLWFIALQLVLAYLSGAVGSHSEVRNTKSSLTESLRVTSREKLKRIQSADMHMEAVKTNTVCWATLLGHVTGFAAINAWGTLQQAVPQNLFSCTLVPALTLAGIFCIYQTTEKLRKMQTELDGEEDHFEELWGEQVAETEDDVMSLAVSFLLVQALRFAISGHLPNVEGNDPEGLRQPNICSELLLFSGFLFGGFDLMRISLRKAWAKFRQEGDEEAVSDHSFNELDEEHRFSTWTRDIMAMGTAWCLHFSVDWWLSANIYADGAVLAVICAVVVTCFALGLIFVLDKLADMDFTDDEVDSSLRALIQSLGILIGFSWERSFDEAVGGLAEGQVFGLPPPVLTLMLAIVLASMVIPAWKWYILPVVLAHQAESRKHHEHHSEHGSPVHVLGLKKPLLEDSGHSAPEITDVDADLRKKLEAAYKSIKDLEATLAERDAAVAEAKLRHSDLESALASAQRGAEEHSNLRLQKEKELQQKEQQIGGYERRLKAAEDAAKASQSDLDQMRSIQKTAQTQADTAELYGKQLLSLQEALAQAKAMAADQEALGNQWKQVAQDEAGKRAALEVALTKRSSALAELEAEKNAELDRMAAVATDSECRLRPAQAALAEHEQAASKTAANDLKEQLAKALEQVNQASNQLAAAEKESLVLRAEVSRLRENKTPSFVPMFAGRAARTTHPIGPSSPQEVPVATPPVPGLSQPIRPAAFASPSLNTMPPSLKAMPQLKAAPKAATSVRRVPPKPKASSANSPQKRSPAKTQL